MMWVRPRRVWPLVAGLFFAVLVSLVLEFGTTVHLIRLDHQVALVEARQFRLEQEARLARAVR